MAATETKIIQVNNDPQVINETNALYGSFGWIVQNVQITHTKNSTVTHEQVGDVIFENKETETINYATITYQRSRGMDHYDEIAALEREYETLTKRMIECKAAYHTCEPSLVWPWLLAPVTWPIAIFKYLKNKAKEAERNEMRPKLDAEYKRMKARREVVLSTAISLCE